MEGNSTLFVDLQAITHNVGVLRSLCHPDVAFCAVLKADGYGLGANGVASAVLAAGSSMLAVFSTEEASQILNQPLSILILMPVRGESLSGELIESIQAGQLHFVVHDAIQMKSLEALGLRLGLQVPVHLKVDTGLHRGGCAPRDAVVLVRTIRRSKGLRLAGLMTHFAQASSSETATANQMRQLNSIQEAIRDNSDMIVHASGTCGVLRGHEYHADMVRVGLGWSGYLTPAASAMADRLPEPLRPSVTWRSRITLVRTIAQGEGVGYGARWVAERPTRLGVIPVGYADGYPHDGGNPADGGPGLSVGLLKRSKSGQDTVPIIGRVSMDQIMVDLTDAPDVDVDCPIDLISASRGSACGLENLARRLDRSPHSILVQIHARVARCHVPAVMPTVSQATTISGVKESQSIATTSAAAG
ncbi:MAG: alanine racemase [Phycisphaerales bacterium]|nr:alanine racemase [Phycisphaerales bacterium]